MMRLFLLTINILALSFYQATAAGVPWSINTYEAPSVTAEEVAKRYQEDEIEEQQSSLFLRTTRAQWGGGEYKLAEKKAILEKHNQYRRGVSPGSVDMNELVWNSKLAEKAQEWSNGCFYDHPDKDEHTYYQGIGQNLYISWLDEGGQNRPPVTDPVDKWYDEVRDYRYQDNSCSKVCGHYTQVVWAETMKVGCGIKFCPRARNQTYTFENAWLVTCNYSPGGNMVGQLPYKKGNTQCSGCKGFCRDDLCSKCRRRDEGCECNKVCHNCGRLDREKCTCTCADGYYGPSCEERCENKHEWCGANPGWPKSWCTNKEEPYVYKLCPAMCGTCTPGSGQTQC